MACARMGAPPANKARRDPNRKEEEMTRNLKALGLALAAVFAMSAVSAAGAQATVAHFTGGSEPTYLTAETDPGANPHHIFNTEFGEWNCDMFEAEGQAAATGTTATFTNIEEWGTTGDTGGPCEAFGLEMELNFNSCHYTFHAGTWNGTDATGTRDIQCTNAGDEIEVIVAGGGLCDVTIPPQNGINNITYTNAKTGNFEEVTIHTTSNNIEYEGHGLFCEEEAFSNGEYEGTATIKGYSDAAHTTQTDVTVQSSNT